MKPHKNARLTPSGRVPTTEMAADSGLDDAVNLPWKRLGAA
jgi:hypothetical protein